MLSLPAQPSPIALLYSTSRSAHPPPPPILYGIHLHKPLPTGNSRPGKEAAGNVNTTWLCTQDVYVCAKIDRDLIYRIYLIITSDTQTRTWATLSSQNRIKKQR